MSQMPFTSFEQIFVIASASALPAIVWVALALSPVSAPWTPRVRLWAGRVKESQLISAPESAPGSIVRFPLSPRLPKLMKELLDRERRLTMFALLLLGLLAPMALALLVDDRTLRGVDVWVKPMKFAASISLLAMTTAWFVSHLPQAVRAGRAVERIVWILIGAGGFELTYITLQATLGQASHYNVGNAFHGIMYSLMGIGAVLLTATQPMLAWQLYRRPDPARPAAMRQAVLLGLVLTFVLGAGVGALLSGLQPPSAGATLPITGWSLAGGDLRPAHFFGIHAGQLLPLIGFATVRWKARRPTWVVGFATLAYSALFIGLLAWGLAGRL